MIRCTFCDRETPLDDRIQLDEPDEYLCYSCDEKLREKLDEFTNNHQSDTK